MRKMKKNNFKFSQQYPSNQVIEIEEKKILKSLSVLNEKGSFLAAKFVIYRYTE